MLLIPSGTSLPNPIIHTVSLPLGATAALIPADPWLILTRVGSLGESMGLNEAHTYKKLGFLKIVPADVNSALYFIGNGTTFILISGGLATMA